MSLASRVAVIGLLGLIVLAAVLLQGLRWAADSIADHNTDTYLATYADVLVPAIRFQGGMASVDAANPVIASMPRDWQISENGIVRQRSVRLKSALPVHASTNEAVRFRSADADGREIDALQKDYRFPDERIVTVTFGMDAVLADGYAAEQRDALRQKLRPLFVVTALVAAALLASQIGVLVWPLKRIRDDLARLERGESERLSERYPSELRALARSVNRQLERSDTTLERYRQFASNLSHAIKTPLTALRLQVESDEARRDLDAIDAIVERNLARARIAGERSSAASVLQAQPLLEGLVRSYRKLSDVSIELRVDSALSFKGDPQDFVEAVGNVLENACRYASAIVTVAATSGQIVIEDDGPAIPVDQYDEVLKRGSRLDEAETGSGIGLAIAGEIVATYGGSITLDARAGGGLRVSIDLPTLEGR